MINLIHAFAERGVTVDLLRVRNHGPHLSSVPETVRVIDLARITWRERLSVSPLPAPGAACGPAVGQGQGEPRRALGEAYGGV
jgi:hypothetical protein